MRTPFIAGNWKMHTTLSEASALAAAVAAKPVAGVELAVCPPFVYLEAVSRCLKAGPVALGAQDMYFEPKGAFTGEISAAMLLDLGCRYVIIGHSERRHVLGETDALIRRKMQAASVAGLRPILCVGETLQERQAGKTFDVVERHVREGLADVPADRLAVVTIAYEPVWAIGTGVNATPEQAQEVHARIRVLVAQVHGKAIADTIRIQYGGSVKPENAREILAKPDVDGALVGGASLKAESFLGIAAAAV